MKKKSVIILLALIFLSCKKDLSPLLTESFIYSTGKSINGLYEFRVSNILVESQWYWAHTENAPIYQYSILSGTGWKDGGPGWCGTGLMMFELKPGESFSLALPKPRDNRPWRAGIRIYNSPEDEGIMVWSQKIE